MIKLLIFFAAIFIFAHSQLIQKQKLKFKLSGRELPDKDNIGLSDPYVKLYFTETGHNKETKFGQSDTISDTVNPTWGNVFEFDYDRSKGQKWFFKVYDHDTAREDDTIGTVWVVVDDFVDKGQNYTANLPKKGTLTIQSTDQVTNSTTTPRPNVTEPTVNSTTSKPNVTETTVQPVTVMTTVGPTRSSSSVHITDTTVQTTTVPTESMTSKATIVQQIQPNVPILVQAVINQPKKLRFQISARGLPDTDLFGTIDPYVKAYYTDEKTKLEQLFGRTEPMKDQQNPNFKEVFEFEYIKGKKQRWHFVILDEDNNRQDDRGGEAFIDVEDFVQSGESLIVGLSKGQILLRKHI